MIYECLEVSEKSRVQVLAFAEFLVLLLNEFGHLHIGLINNTACFMTQK